eukprot:scaffold99074_cov21-Tisochrysis_lutea.AAC.1
MCLVRETRGSLSQCVSFSLIDVGSVLTANSSNHGWFASFFPPAHTIRYAAGTAPPRGPAQLPALQSHQLSASQRHVHLIKI